MISMLALSGCAAAGSGGGGELSYEDSPLGMYTTALYGDIDQEKFEAQQAEVEELVAACMKEEGFEYLPNTQNGGGVVMSSDDMEDRETEEWVASNGYGMIQSAEQMAEQQAQSEEFVDPNAEYTASLSESEQAAFYETLYGPGPSEEEMEAMEAGDGSYEYNWETAGCQGAAQNEVQGGAQDAYNDPKFAGLFEKMNELYTKAMEQPAVKELDAKWADCMADAGYSEFTSKSEAMMSISDAQNEFYENQEFDETGVPIAPDEAAMEELRQKEIDVALADFRCSEKLDYMQKSLEAQFALETQFVEDNKSELDALLAEYATGK
ncbi:hypothetical protein [Leifsonia sp. Root4]|uniref:hypothetical protein n=1 Tax=Leifsonia sp. Root4 TaxID=1736525 RepID=UPI000B057748|nr:hypothetical protein [Leifsonia sp. Root4]